jgi:hypothetical protein
MISIWEVRNAFPTPKRLDVRDTAVLLGHCTAGNLKVCYGVRDLESELVSKGIQAVPYPAVPLNIANWTETADALLTS